MSMCSLRSSSAVVGHGAVLSLGTRLLAASYQSSKGLMTDHQRADVTIYCGQYPLVVFTIPTAAEMYNAPWHLAGFENYSHRDL